eukprot:357319-Hanusia_phi.AAC.5
MKETITRLQLELASANLVCAARDREIKVLTRLADHEPAEKGAERSNLPGDCSRHHDHSLPTGRAAARYREVTSSCESQRGLTVHLRRQAFKRQLQEEISKVGSS